jgi:hypothetical protein
MKLTKIAIGIAVVALLAATMQPAQAACSTPRLLNAFGAYLVSNPNWGGSAATGGNGNCGSFGCYESDSDAPVSANLGGSFWAWVDGAADGGDPKFFVGSDNGTWDSGAWTMQVSQMFGGGLYHYPAFLSELNQSGNSSPGLPPNWGRTSAIDGCAGDVTPSIPNDECTCILLTDEWDGVGYFALLSARSTGNGNFEFPDEIIRFAPIPQPSITMSERDDLTSNVTFQVGIPGIPAAGDYRQGSCHCDVGFRVISQLVGREGTPPSGRSTCTAEDYENADPDVFPPGTPITDICQGLGFDWIPAEGAGGGAQAVTPIADQAMVTVSCDPAVQSDLYLSTAFVAAAAGGISGPNSSNNSFRLECGANVVEDPTRPDRNQGRSDDAPRGRDDNRGRGGANGRR